MSHEAHHEHLIKELTEQLTPVFENSPQGIYLYLDDTHKSCNQRFADMLGYTSVAEWVANEFPIEDFAEEDREKGIQAYLKASEHFTPSTVNAHIVRKDGRTIAITVTMVPLSYKNEVFVLHFLAERNK